MKFLFGLLIILSMAKECNKCKDSTAIDSIDSTEKFSNKNIPEENTMTAITQNPSGKYYIISLKEADIDSLNLTLNFVKDSNKVLGFSGCNRFSGTYTIIKDSIFFGRLITTKMYCEKTQKTENLLIRHLSNTNSFSIKGNELSLKNNDETLIIAQKETIVNVQEAKQLQENIKIEYRAISRGSYSHITITPSTVLVQKDRNSKALSKACSKGDWTKLMDLLNTIDLKNVSNLKAPTEARFYDGAAIAQLIILKENVTFESSSFDHGNPPKEIEALVQEILSMSENIE